MINAYDITPKEKKAIWTRQNHRCPICNKYQNLNQIHIDHTEDEDGNAIVRGLLCSNCNLGIDNLQYNIDILRSAIQYLQGKSYNVSMKYSAGELIDRISISELKLHHLQKATKQPHLTHDDATRIEAQIGSQEAHIHKLRNALTAYIDNQQIEHLTNITKSNIAIWELESQMADDSITDEEKAAIQDEIINQNTRRVDNVDSINELWDAKH